MEGVNMSWEYTTWIAAYIRAINNVLCYIQYALDIHNNIVYEVSEGVQGVSWTT